MANYTRYKTETLKKNGSGCLGEVSGAHAEALRQLGRRDAAFQTPVSEILGEGTRAVLRHQS